MEHFIGYHNAEKMGATFKAGLRNGFNASYNKKSTMETALGQVVWVINGEKSPERKGRKDFTLHCGFRPDAGPYQIDADPLRYRIDGRRDFLFDPPLVVNDLGWFRALYEQQRNFSLGFSRVTDPGIVAALEEYAFRYGIPQIGGAPTNWSTRRGSLSVQTKRRQAILAAGFSLPSAG
jgi:hypothetical protein